MADLNLHTSNVCIYVGFNKLDLYRSHCAKLVMTLNRIQEVHTPDMLIKGKSFSLFFKLTVTILKTNRFSKPFKNYKNKEQTVAEKVLHAKAFFNVQ